MIINSIHSTERTEKKITAIIKSIARSEYLIELENDYSYEKKALKAIHCLNEKQINFKCTFRRQQFCSSLHDPYKPSTILGAIFYHGQMNLLKPLLSKGFLLNQSNILDDIFEKYHVDIDYIDVMNTLIQYGMDITQQNILPRVIYALSRQKENTFDSLLALTEFLIKKGVHFNDVDAFTHSIYLANEKVLNFVMKHLDFETMVKGYEKAKITLEHYQNIKQELTFVEGNSALFHFIKYDESFALLDKVYFIIEKKQLEQSVSHLQNESYQSLKI
jgi:hypothetical protein